MPIVEHLATQSDCCMIAIVGAIAVDAHKLIPPAAAAQSRRYRLAWQLTMLLLPDYHWHIGASHGD